MRRMTQSKSFLSFVAVFFIFALVSACCPADDQLLGTSGSFDQPAVIHTLPRIDPSLSLIGTSVLLAIPFNIPKYVASSGETRAPPA